MAQALEVSFDEWIRSLLNELQSNDADMSDFVQYLMGIVTSDSETDDEKLAAITELLADLDLKHNHPIETISQQILDRWNSSEQNEDRSHTSTINKNRIDADQQDDDAINTALINAMNQMESSAKQKDFNANKLNEDAILKKHKTQVLAKYSEVSDEEFDYGDESETQGNGLFHNTNAQEVEERDRKAREIQHEAHRKQQEKHKIDAANQKQKDEDRKKKAQQRAQKQERRR